MRVMYFFNFYLSRQKLFVIAEYPAISPKISHVILYPPALV